MVIKYEKTLKSKLVGLIPGYGGYKKRENRRETDRLVREKAISFVDHAKDATDQLTGILLQTNNRSVMPISEKLRQAVDVTLHTVRTGEYGYSGIFDVEKVDKDKLEKLTEYDARIVIKSKQFQKHAEELTDRALSEPDNISQSIMGLQREIEVLKKDFERRRDIINGMEDIESEVDYFDVREYDV
ncbi:MAG: hypothetical protein PHS47_06150 [Methanocellales archaeon]|nr:hypothetical protein [Methanocellales archaeon]